MNGQRVIFRDKPATVSEAAVISADSPLQQRVIAVLRSVYDPELPVNIYDLGLIYDLRINQQSEVFVSMTLTAPACPVAGSLPGQVECAIKALEGVSHARVELVWDPPWSQDRMSEEAKLSLGLY